jgi:hypothetical protein
MKLAACFLVLSAGVCSAALAEEPQSPAAQTPSQTMPAQTTPEPTTVASATANTSEAKPAPGAPVAPVPKADKSTVVDAAPTEAEIKQMRGRGYKPVTRNGTVVFCRSEGELGSHFPRTRCNTLKELKDSEQGGKDYVNSIQRLADPFKGP